MRFSKQNVDTEFNLNSSRNTNHPDIQLHSDNPILHRKWQTNEKKTSQASLREHNQNDFAKARGE